MELKILNLSKEFSDVKAVDQISMILKPGVIGLLGENGAGKTTLMRMLCTLMKPGKGQITYNGQDIFSMDTEYRKILGYLPQDFGYYPDLNAMDYLGYIASIKGLRPTVAKKRIRELLQIVSLWEVRKKKIKRFSGGMKQRLGIAQALLNDPKILIMDEPTAGLDPEERYRFRQLLNTLGENKIILLSTHIVSDVEQIAQEIILMHKGKILDTGSVEQLIQKASIRAWKLEATFEEADELACHKIITSSVRTDKGENIRVLSKDRPMAGAIEDKCTLEDVFLYYNRRKRNHHVVL